MSAELATAYISLVPTFQGGQKAIAKGMGGDAAGREAGRQFGRGFISSAKSVVAGVVVYQGLSKAASFAKGAIFDFNSQLQNATIAFTTMLGSGEKAKAFLDQLQQFAKSTPFDFPGLVTSSQQLLAFGFKASEVIPTLTAIGDASAGLSLGAEGVARLTMSIGQIKAKGKVQGDELMQLTEAGVPALKILANGMGMTTGALQDMISKGLLPAEKAIPLLLGGLEKGTNGAAGATAKFGGLMEAQSHTFTGALSNIGDSLNQTIAGAFLPFFDATSSGLQGLSTSLGGPGFKHFGAMVGTYLVAAMHAAGTALKAIGPIAMRVFREVLVPAFVALRAAVPKVVTTIRNLWAVVGPLASTVAGALVVAWRAALALFSKVIPILASVTGWMRQHKTLVQTLAVVVGTAVIAWKAWQLAIKTWSMVTKLATGIQAAFNVVMAMNPVVLVVIAVLALAAGLIYAYKHSATFRAIVQAAFAVVLLVAQAVANFFMHQLPAAFMWVVHGLQTAWGAAVRFLRTWGPVALAVLVPFIGIPLLIAQHFGQIKGFLSRAFSAALSAVTGFVGKIVSAVASIPGKLGGIGTKMLAAGKALMTALWNGLKSVASGAGDLASGLVRAIKDGLNNLLNLPFAIPHITIGIAGHNITIGGQTLIPRLAAGGMTTGPMAALIGDNPGGRELVMPMDSPRTVSLLASALSKAAPAGMGDIHVYIGQRELTDIVRVEYGQQSRRTARQLADRRRF